MRIAALLLGALGIADLVVLDVVIAPQWLAARTVPATTDALSVRMAGVGPVSNAGLLPAPAASAPSSPPRAAESTTVAQTGAGAPSANVEASRVAVAPKRDEEAAIPATSPEGVIATRAAGKLRWRQVATVRFPVIGASEVEADSEVGKAAASIGASNRVRVRGHTDAMGQRAFNRALGQRRAEGIAAQLERVGVDRTRIVIETAGELEPLARGSGRAARAANRRVEIFIEES